MKLVQSGFLGKLRDNLGLFKVTSAKMGIIMAPWGSLVAQWSSVWITEDQSDSVRLCRVQ